MNTHISNFQISKMAKIKWNLILTPQRILCKLRKTNLTVSKLRMCQMFQNWYTSRASSQTIFWVLQISMIKLKLSKKQETQIQFLTTFNLFLKNCLVMNSKSHSLHLWSRLGYEANINPKKATKTSQTQKLKKPTEMVNSKTNTRISSLKKKVTNSLSACSTSWI